MWKGPLQITGSKSMLHRWGSWCQEGESSCLNLVGKLCPDKGFPAQCSACYLTWRKDLMLNFPLSKAFSVFRVCKDGFEVRHIWAVSSIDWNVSSAPGPSQVSSSVLPWQYRSRVCTAPRSCVACAGRWTCTGCWDSLQLAWQQTSFQYLLSSALLWWTARMFLPLQCVSISLLTGLESFSFWRCSLVLCK